MSKPRVVVNPSRVFAPDTHYQNLAGKSFEEVVKIFSRRVQVWYLDQALRCKGRDGGFLRTTMSCIVLDLLSQYYFDLQNSQETGFRKFLLEKIPQFNQPIDPKIQSSTYRKGEWCVEQIDSLDKAFWHGFRCGIIHNGMILEYGRISASEVAPKIVQLREREDKNGTEVAVNPALLLERINQLFQEYIRQLLGPSETELRKKFAAKFERDFGVALTSGNLEVVQIAPPR